MSRLSRQDILAALDALARELSGVSERAELYVVGGAAVVLLYGARQSTKDVDAAFDDLWEAQHGSRSR